MAQKKLALLGCGKMGGALVRGISSVASMQEQVNFLLYDVDVKKASALALEIGDRAALVEEVKQLAIADIYLVACKPQQFDNLAVTLGPSINHEALLISILAGTSVAKIMDTLAISKVVRAMPNTPALIGEGVTALFFTKAIQKNDRQLVWELFKTISNCYIFDKEEELNVITGFSGSGPAYFFEIARILSAEMIKMGIAAEVSREMIKYTMLGAAKLLAQSSESAETLRNNVTSPQGVTYEALEVFKNERSKNLEELFQSAMSAAYKRAGQLAS
ncbi:MAG: pyrroline-5-carboxylate reductase [Bdellovibrionales bacterium RIFOXYD12_FULL_39_22]|nr:MAG: pyrroline-5-carboxylate reductase [Bdellovibrionales bacterium RIFOXYB1_FULL_39_21]OFZ44444.1 MAG: pyrroline-5-carboxylate reductase [Bdellovibrionales bacterium RIFOXYC12_FULL_39_17]OFZ49914.1 MAG: pyrroline-5-carboxylate reductase [Bdellovibrionales bacterium RIFOXYC1_FULL_39_130]OFZ76919.1 MAG: pyrroline-5-carboxylate reductase [Bdellovibrionales bacterium RIFOXYD1_FULL_39_84]OFZ95846.1 MAG: pyrroline-5-carboxylate reductase [Bdellovibrionales bacterium RIFOXYD12_FULL_39_22]HLE10867